MRFAAALSFVVITSALNGATITLTRETPLQLGKGSITLLAGSVVEVLSSDGALATILYRNLKGQVPAAAVGLAPSNTKAATGVAEFGSVPVSHPSVAVVFADQLRDASQKIMPAIKAAESLTVQGRFDDANALILGTFPEATRTPVETFVLGNVLFRAEPRLSYDLHKRAALALPDEADVLLEWALEQHRAKDYAGAAKTYQAFSALRPNYAPALGLAAECAIRRGRIGQAVQLWKQSERATNGTLQQLEAMVCEVNGEIRNDSTRLALMRRAEAGDQVAAGELLLHDCSWNTDWWNNGPSYRRLENDFALVTRVISAPDADLRAALCAAQCALESHREQKNDVADVMARNGFLVDENATLPSNGKAVSCLLNFALSASPLKVEEARTKFGETILERARVSKDAEMYNAAAFLFRDTDKLDQIEQEGWDATHDARFATSLVVGMALHDKLTLTDPLLQRALKEFPENSEIAHVAVSLAVKNNVPVQPYLVEGIKAEYTKFSSARPGVDAPRPGAFVLRSYFAMLESLGVKENSVAATD